MAAIRCKDTKPEIVVRTTLHALGYRFRLHSRNLPGTPDIVLPKYRTVIFVHGCFWHSHDCRYGRVTPATRSEFWSVKRAGTVERDQRKISALEAEGWQVVTIWECETREPSAVDRLLRESLNRRGPSPGTYSVSVKIPSKVSRGH